MQWSGGADTAGCEILTTSAVAILFSLCPVVRHCTLCSIRTCSSLDEPPATFVSCSSLRRLRPCSFVFLLGRRVVDLYARSRLQGAQNLVAAGDDLVAFLQPAQHFDVGGTGDAGFDRNELGFLACGLQRRPGFLLSFLFWTHPSAALQPARNLSSLCVGLQIRFAAGRSAPGSGWRAAFLRVAVVILAVVDRPGRKSSGGSCKVTTTLKSLASWLAEIRCEVATPVERTMALLPISVTTAVKGLLGNGVDRDFGGLAELHVDDVGLVHLHFGGNDRHVGKRHRACCRASSGCR